MGPREGTQEGVGVRSFVQGERGQLHAHRPPLRPAVQRGEGLRSQVEPPDLPQEGRRLLGGESKVGGPQLGELASCTKPGQRKRRIAPAGDHDVKLGREVAQQERHAIVDRLRLHPVVVVQDQGELLGRGNELVDQGGYHTLARPDISGTEEWKHALTNASAGTIERDHDVPPEPHRVVVLCI